MNRKQITASIVIVVLCIAGIAALAFWPLGSAWPFNEKEVQERHRTRIIVPMVPDNSGEDFDFAEQILYEESFQLLAPLDEGETAVSTLNFDFNNDSIEEQVVAYRKHTDAGSPISVAFVAYDESRRTYRRLRNAVTEATVPGTISLYTMDLLGDRNTCVIITGMNAQGDYTMMVFRETSAGNQELRFETIAEILIDGPITIQETERPLAYRQGITRGQPFAITAVGRDETSANILDRIEITYTFNPARGIYEQTRITRIPGSQIEQRRLREILSGNARVFENFINDLWYHVSPQGTIDRSQYIYFDPAKREIIFFADDVQQVFAWQQSTSTRYGLYVTSQNISVTTLRRFLDIELESLDSVRMRVFEDVRLKIGISASWDGSYRRAGNIPRDSTRERTISQYINAVYDSSMGRLIFHASGEYELSSAGILTKGRYVFFRADDRELLELRPDRNSLQANAARNDSIENRIVYAVTSGADISISENFSLTRVRLGATGVQDLHEAHVVLTRAGE